MNENVIEFYRKVRDDEALSGRLMYPKDAADLARRSVALARELGLDFTEDDARAALGNLPEVMGQAVNDDELTDDELELVAAGAVIGSCEGRCKNDY